MGYNYADAFKEAPTICDKCGSEIGFNAMLRYREEFSDCHNFVDVVLRIAERTVFVYAEGFPERLYTFRELGFENAC